MPKKCNPSDMSFQSFKCVIYGISYAHFKTRKFPKIVPNWTLDRVSEKKTSARAAEL